MLPCGHLGEHVLNRYVECVVCDAGAVPEHVDFEKTEPMPAPHLRPYWSNDPKTCQHPARYTYGQRIWCTSCGKFLRRAP